MVAVVFLDGIMLEVFEMDGRGHERKVVIAIEADNFLFDLESLLHADLLIGV